VEYPGSVLRTCSTISYMVSLFGMQKRKMLSSRGSNWCMLVPPLLSRKLRPSAVVANFVYTLLFYHSGLGLTSTQIFDGWAGSLIRPPKRWDQLFLRPCFVLYGVLYCLCSRDRWSRTKERGI
jgi:hypothetical protein